MVPQEVEPISPWKSWAREQIGNVVESIVLGVLCALAVTVIAVEMVASFVLGD